MYIVWYFNVNFMVFSYEGGAISPTSRAKSFNSSHRSNFCTSRILWKLWRCWQGSWVKAKARELATCGRRAFGRKPPGSGPMPLPCFIVLRNSFWAWCWARQCAIWQLCVRRPNLGTLALQELQNSIPVKSLYRKMELWGAAVDEASFNTAFRAMQDWAGRLAFSSVEPFHLSPVEHVALRPWGCPRFATTNLIGVKNAFLRCNLRMRSWLRWNTSSCLTWGQNFLQAFCGRRNETCFFPCLELFLFANRDKYRDWVGCRLMFGIAAVILEGNFFLVLSATWQQHDTPVWPRQPCQEKLM